MHSPDRNPSYKVYILVLGVGGCLVPLQAYTDLDLNRQNRSFTMYYFVLI